MTETRQVDLASVERQRLARFWPRIAQNWRQALRAGGDLLWFAAGNESSVSSFRSTNDGWSHQHGLTDESDFALLATAAGRPATEGCSLQSWFRPTHPALRAVESIEDRFGISRASVESYDAFSMSPGFSRPTDSDLLLARVTHNHGGQQDDLVHLATATRGRIYVEAEELDGPDIGLECLDQRYREVGLRRFREIWLCYSRSRREAVGAVIAYRGPLGLDFRFLENRCDILSHPVLTRTKARAAILSLLAAVAPLYQDFEPGEILVVGDPETCPLIADRGASPMGRLAHAILCRTVPGELAEYAATLLPARGRLLTMPARNAA